jgi:signal transduction histidine kinase/DNA-binding response OmpR family regulator
VRLRDSGLSYAVVVLCAIATIWTAIYLRLLREYQQAESAAYQQTTDLAVGNAELARRDLDAIDQTLLFARAAYQRDRAGFDLRRWAGQAPERGASYLGIMDAAGILRASTDNAPAWPTPIDAATLSELGTSGPDEMLLSLPVRDSRSQAWSLNAIRRITGADGQPDGFVVASLPSSLLTQFHAALAIGGAITVVVGPRGQVVARDPVSQDGIGVPYTGGDAVLQLAPDAAAGTLRRLDAAGVTSRLISFQRVAPYGLTVLAGLPEAQVFATFRQHRLQTTALGIVLTVLISVGALIMLRQHQRLSASREALEVTLQSIDQGILMIDADGQMPVMNRRLVELLEIPDSLLDTMPSFMELVQWQFDTHEFGPPEQAPETIVAQLASGRPLIHNEVMQRTRPNGQVLEVHTTLLRRGGAVRTFTDVTDQHRNQAALSAALDAAEAAGRARSEFLAVMSHEIRTPMNGIIGVAGLLLDMRLGATEQHYVRIMLESGQHLLQLINDILDFSRLDAGRLELEETPFDIAAVVRGTIELLSQQARAKGLTLQAEIGEDVPRGLVGDPNRLRQVLLNLISNGLKFTHAGEVRVVVSRTRFEPEGVRLNISVSDTGIGIPQQALGRLFKEFTQVDNSISRRFGGSGLGLAISRRLIERMGGSIGVESTEGKGSTFSFNILLRLPDPGTALPITTALRPIVPPPIAASPPPRAPAARAATRPAARPAGAAVAPAAACRTVLVAEDNATNRLVVTRMLERLGYKVEAVENGHEAVAAVRQGGHDAVLMDVMMPEMDGLAATQAIRALGGDAATLPIIGLSANAMQDSQARCLAAGMTQFEAKPISAGRLAEVLAGALGDGAAAAETAAAAPNGQRHFDPAVLDQLVRDIAVGPTLDVVNHFIAMMPIQLARMADLAAGEPAALAPAASRLARAARGVGLARLAQAAAELAASPAPHGIEARLRDMQAMLRTGIDELRAWRPTA